MELWRFKLTGSGYPQIFSAPQRRNYASDPKSFGVLEVQENAGGPLSPCQVWWGSVSLAAGAAKNVELFVCPCSLLFTALGVSDAAGFAAARRCLRFLVYHHFCLLLSNRNITA